MPAGIARTINSYGYGSSTVHYIAVDNTLTGYYLVHHSLCAEMAVRQLDFIADVFQLFTKNIEKRQL